MAKHRTTLLPAVGFIWNDGSEVIAHSKGQGGRALITIKCGGCAQNRTIRHEPSAVGGRCIHCHASSNAALILAWAARKKALQERLEKQAITGLKKCAQCREELPLEAFYGRSNARDGRADYCTPCIRKRKREQMYGITNETFEAMAEAQRGICAINTCKEPFDVVDHCHETNHVRGLLCERHNLLLHQSITPEELGAMAEYLNKSTSKKHITSEQ